MRMIDADAVVKYLHEFRCADCDRRKGLKNGKIRFCYEIGDAPCRACDIGDTIEYFLDEDIAPTIDAIPVEWLDWRIEHARKEGFGDIVKMLTTVRNWWNDQKDLWREEREQEART